jgi:lipoprotein-anchoring transpeptidase ErfK/SrfK
MKSTPQQILAAHDRVPDDTILMIDIAGQTLSLYRDGKMLHQWPVSSSCNGIGNLENSFKTPTGTHRIAEKIGDGAAIGSVFRGRVDTGEIAEIIHEPVAGTTDLITTRILWLDGLEAGINRGEGIDSHSRFIYIHGTPEEGRIGSPASQGCIRMRNQDIIDLFDLVETDTLVHIES